jgi:hypothetical protein
VSLGLRDLGTCLEELDVRALITPNISRVKVVFYHGRTCGTSR